MDKRTIEEEIKDLEWLGFNDRYSYCISGSGDNEAPVSFDLTIIPSECPELITEIKKYAEKKKILLKQKRVIELENEKSKLEEELKKIFLNNE